MPVHSPDTPTPLMAAPKVNMPTSTPARKVVGASAGAGLGGVTAGLILWALGAYVFDGGVPDAVTAFVGVLTPLAMSFLGGYFTRRSAAEVASLQVPPPAPAPTLSELVDAHTTKPVKKTAAKKTAAKRPAKKAAPKPQGLS